MDSHTVKVMQDVIRERRRQDKKYGPNQRHPLEEWMLILAKEQGEALMALDVCSDTGTTLFLRRELISIAATAMAAVEDIDKTNRNNHTTRPLPIPETKIVSVPIVEFNFVKRQKRSKERSTEATKR